MRRQVTALDQAQRKALFDQVQKIVAEQQPMIQFAAPRIYLATSTRVVTRRRRCCGRPSSGTRTRWASADEKQAHLLRYLARRVIAAACWWPSCRRAPCC